MNDTNTKEHWNRVWKEEGLDTWRQYPWVNGELARKVHDGEKVLELGCGNGVLASRIKELRNVKLYDGIDLSRAAVEQARERLDHDPQFMFTDEDAREWLPVIPTMHYDVVIASEFLEHFETRDVQHLLRECKRIAMRAVFAVPNNRLGPDEHDEHHQKFTKESLRAALEEHWLFVHIIETEELDIKNQIGLPVLIAECSDTPYALPRVLIAAPVAGLKQYSINLWFDYIINQDHPAYDVALCCNFKEKEKLAEMLRQVSWTDKHGKQGKPIVMVLPDEEDITLVHRLNNSRERLRRYAVQNGYDALWWLDTDTIPPSKDALTRLLSWEKPAVSGLYHYKKSYQPVIVSKEKNANASWEDVKASVYGNRLHRISGCGFGCFLVRGQALHLPFDYYRKGEDYSEDLSWNEAAEENGIEQWMDAVILCKHFGADDFEISIDQAPDSDSETFNKDRSHQKTDGENQ